MGIHNFLAFDLGAESGRAILGALEQGKLSLREMHRFPTGMLQLEDHFQWNIYRLFEEMKKALSICAKEKDLHIESMAFDTWGVDYGLLSKDGNIIGLPYCYRDPRTNGIMDEFFKIIPKERVYKLTGIQFMQFNTLFQLFAAKRAKSPSLDIATDLLFIADLFNYLFTGKKKSEFTFATTSQLYNPVKKNWESDLFNTLGVPMSLMQDIVAPGSILGPLNENICHETGISPMWVSAVASHDTGSAIVAIPAKGKNFAYISSGTWSLMGIETMQPLISDTTLRYNFTNEGGAEGTFRFLKNIMGLWLLQQCRKSWNTEKDYSYSDIVDMAKTAPAFESLIDPDCYDFLNPTDMPEAIKNFCRKTGQKVPDTDAKVARCIMESLALKYRYTLDQLKECATQPIDKVHIIGGGTQNQLLCQFAANAMGLPVIAGPAEGTATGNIMIQALALGYVKDIDQIRDVINVSFDTAHYKPMDIDAWNMTYKKFIDIVNVR
jgi:rhamnulokinase